MKGINDYKLGKIDIYKLCHSFDEANTENKNGIIYTPEDIALKVINESGVLSEASLKKITVLEPSIGHGVFVFALLLELKKKFSTSEIMDFLFHRFTCVELNSKSIKGFLKILEAFLEKEFGIDLANSGSMNLYTSDFLAFSMEKESNTYDYCVGNPPYIRFQDLSEDQRIFIKTNFNSCKSGNFDIFYAFSESASRISKKMSLIIPNSILQNKSAKLVRKELENKIDKIYDYSAHKVFPGVGTYTCIITTNTHQKNKIQYQEHKKGIFKINRKSLYDANMWVFKDGEQKSEEGNSINKNHIFGGIATISDKCYIIKKIKDNKDGTTTFFSKLTNQNERVETTILAKYLKLTKIKSQKDADNYGDFIISPYRNQVIIDEDTLKKEFPLTHAYFNKKEIKEKLLNRDKGKISKYDTWYAFGRKQGFHALKNKSLIIIPGIFDIDENPVKIKVKEDFFFSNGLIIEDHNYYHFLITKRFKKFALTKGKPWAGKKSYVSLSKTILARFILK